MKIQVRPATEDDAPDACKVIQSSILECCADDHRGDAEVLEGWLRNKTPEFVRRFILEPAAFSVVASVDEETVGFGSALKTGEVTLCYVAPSVRFKGAGKLRNGFVAEGPPVLAFGIEGQPMRKDLRPGG